MTTTRKKRFQRSKVSTHRWSFDEIILPLILQADEEDVCHKTAGFRLGVSESTVKAARTEGMDEFMLDAMAVHLGQLPYELVDDWLTDESYFAAEIADGNMKLDEVPTGLSYGQLIRMFAKT